MKCVGILVIRANPHAGEAARALISWCRENGVEPLYLTELSGYGIENGVDSEELAQRADVFVVLGGDGTFLAASQLAKIRDVPVLGVNFGRLGFLTEVGIDELYDTLRLALAGELRTREHMMLDGEYRVDGGNAQHRTVLNEFVVNKSDEARVIELRVTVDEVLVTLVRGDGLIISTPTGSTAYSLSAGGPILHPAMQTILLTPICPHSLTFRPMLIPADREVHIEVTSRNREVLITADGHRFTHFDAGGRLTVRRSDARLTKLVSPDRSYFEVLRDKLRWGEA
ncbi:MAG: NAD(+)/NADH kinase [Deltaproteobacteria bacterium]|nr:NAD(+)/NADH kinase [Deltaproteobacteria bacterium]